MEGFGGCVGARGTRRWAPMVRGVTRASSGAAMARRQLQTPASDLAKQRVSGEGEKRGTDAGGKRLYSPGVRMLGGKGIEEIPSDQRRSPARYGKREEKERDGRGRDLVGRWVQAARERRETTGRADGRSEGSSDQIRIDLGCLYYFGPQIRFRLISLFSYFQKQARNQIKGK